MILICQSPCFLGIAKNRLPPLRKVPIKIELSAFCKFGQFKQSCSCRILFILSEKSAHQLTTHLVGFQLSRHSSIVADWNIEMLSEINSRNLVFTKNQRKTITSDCCPLYFLQMKGKSFIPLKSFNVFQAKTKRERHKHKHKDCDDEYTQRSPPKRIFENFGDIQRTLQMTILEKL